MRSISNSAAAAVNERRPAGNQGFLFAGRGRPTTVPLAVVVTVMVTLPELESDVGLRAQVAPVGKPLQLKFNVPADGLRFTAITYCVEPPATMVFVAGVVKAMVMGKTRFTAPFAVLLERSVSPPPETLDVI
jgi:hypothetical protein